jgi:hypothetical protein
MLGCAVVSAVLVGCVGGADVQTRFADRTSGREVEPVPSFEVDAVALSDSSIEAVGGAGNLSSAADVIAELMADRPPLLVPAGVDDLIGYRVSVDHPPDSPDGLNADIRTLIYLVETALPLDEVVGRAEEAIVEMGGYEVTSTERSEDGRRVVDLMTDQGAADVLPHLEIRIAESHVGSGLLEIEVRRVSFDADEVTAETAAPAVRDVLDDIAPQLFELDATLTGWTLDVVTDEATRFESVSVEAITAIGFEEAQDVISALGWERSDSGGAVFYISTDYRSWTVATRGLDVRLVYSD